MKKFLAILLCFVMLLAIAIPIFANVTGGDSGTDSSDAANSSSEEQALPTVPKRTDAGPLVITEVLMRSSTEGYSYVEIMNTSDKQIDLSNYYLFRFGFSNTYSNFYAEGTMQILALSGRNCYNIVAIKLNGTIDPGDIKVIHLNDNKNTNDFVEYWNSLGANLTSDDVIDVTVEPLAANNPIQSSNYSSSNKNFLPRNTYGMCTLALISKDNAIDANGDAITGDTYANKSGMSVKNLLSGADCITILNFMYLFNYEIASNPPEKNGAPQTPSHNITGAHVNMPGNSSINFTSFIEKESFNASVDATVYPSTVTKKNVYYYDDLYAALAVSDASMACEPLMNVIYDNKDNGETNTGYPEGISKWNWNKGDQAVPMPYAALDSSPTPGALDGVQYGVGTAATEKVGPLAITEMCYNPANEKYEFIEIKNISDASVNLKDYYLYRHGFSNGGDGYFGAGISQLFGIKYRLTEYGTNAAENPANPVKMSLAEYDKEIEKGKVIVLWFASADSETETEEDFINYWKSQGCDMNNVEVVKIKVYNRASETDIENLYPANKINGSAGKSFLPDTKAGFTISLVSKAYAETDDITVKTAAKTKERHAAADCVAWTIITGKNTTDALRTVTLSQFIDKAKYAINLGSVMAPNGSCARGIKKALASELPANILTGSRVDPNKENVQLWQNTDKTKAIAFLANTTKSASPTPGKLVNGQFGYDEYVIEGAKTEGGPLVITELCHNPANAKYEYVEVMNISNDTINLKDYYLYRNTFSNGGAYLVNGILQLFGVTAVKNGTLISEPAANTIKISLAAYDVPIEKGEIVILWFASADSADEDEYDFMDYWKLSNANVVRVKVYSEINNGEEIINNYPCSSGTNFGEKHAAGSSFLPDKQAGFTVSLINKSYAEDDDTDIKTSAKTRERHAMADCVAWAVASKGDTARAFTMYQFIDLEGLTSSAEAVTLPSSADSNSTRAVETKELSPTILTGKRTEAGKDDMTYWNNTSDGRYLVFLSNMTKRNNAPTPGVLVNGQFGSDAPDVPDVAPAGESGGNSGSNSGSNSGAETTAPVNDGKRKPTTKLPDDDEDNVNAETEAVTDTETAVVEEEKKGCKSAIATSAIAVMAPALLIGSGLTLRKRRK